MSGRSARPPTFWCALRRQPAVCLTPKTDILPFVGHPVSYAAYRLKYDRGAFAERRSMGGVS